MNNQQINGMHQSLIHLIPSCNIEEMHLSKETLINKYKIPNKLHKSRYGVVTTINRIVLWAEIAKDLYGVIVLKRELAFSTAERKFIDYFKYIITGLLVDHKKKPTDRLISRMASWYSFETILISKYLRRYKNSEFWTPALIINQLLSLTSERYENRSCYSGFIYVSNTEGFIRGLNLEEYSFDKFPIQIDMTPQFFSKPASYRYVDGRNSFYLVNTRQKILGIIRLINPKKYSMIDRLSNKHLMDLFNNHLTRIWIGYIGRNDDVKIILSNKIILTWLKSHWHFTDISIMENYFMSAGITEELSKNLTDLIISISCLRLGTLILIPNDNNILPTIVGKIDDSKLGEQLYYGIINKTLKNIIENNSIIGMLTSDGISIISKTGDILETGAILSVVKNKDSKIIRGGGRTQAAIEASKFGLSIKISEDGPITIYNQEDEILKILV